MDVSAPSALEACADVRRDGAALSITGGEETAERPRRPGVNVGVVTPRMDVG